MDLKPTDRVLVPFAGSGLDTWLAYQAMLRRWNRDAGQGQSNLPEFDITASDKNPLAVANVRTFAKLAGMKIQTGVFDNIISESGETISARKWNKIIANMPSFKPEVAAHRVMPVESLVSYWDKEGGDVLRRFAAGLPAVLDPDSDPRVLAWNTPFFANETILPEADVVTKILESAGEYSEGRGESGRKVFDVRAAYQRTLNYWSGVYRLRFPRQDISYAESRSELREGVEDKLNLEGRSRSYDPTLVSSRLMRFLKSGRVSFRAPSTPESLFSTRESLSSTPESLSLTSAMSSRRGTTTSETVRNSPRKSSTRTATSRAVNLSLSMGDGTIANGPKIVNINNKQYEIDDKSNSRSERHPSPFGTGTAQDVGPFARRSELPLSPFDVRTAQVGNPFDSRSELREFSEAAIWSDMLRISEKWMPARFIMRGKTRFYKPDSLFRLDGLNHIPDSEKRYFSYLKLGDKEALDHFAGMMAERIRRRLGNELQHHDDFRIVIQSMSGVRTSASLLAEKVALRLGIRTVRVQTARPRGIWRGDYSKLSKREKQNYIRRTQTPISVESRQKFKGKNIIFIDDSLVRGVSLEGMRNLMRKRGAASLYAYYVMDLSASGDPSIEDKFNLGGLNRQQDLAEIVSKILSASQPVTTKLLQYLTAPRIFDAERSGKLLDNLLEGLSKDGKTDVLLTLYSDFAMVGHREWVDRLAESLATRRGIALPRYAQTAASMWSDEEENRPLADLLRDTDNRVDLRHLPILLDRLNLKPAIRNFGKHSDSRSERHPAPFGTGTAQDVGPFARRSELPLSPFDSRTVRPENPSDFRSELREAAVSIAMVLKPGQDGPQTVKRAELSRAAKIIEREVDLEALNKELVAVADPLALSASPVTKGLGLKRVLQSTPPPLNGYLWEEKGKGGGITPSTVQSELDLLKHQVLTPETSDKTEESSYAIGISFAESASLTDAGELDELMREVVERDPHLAHVLSVGKERPPKAFLDILRKRHMIPKSVPKPQAKNVELPDESQGAIPVAMIANRIQTMNEKLIPVAFEENEAGEDLVKIYGNRLKSAVVVHLARLLKADKTLQKHPEELNQKLLARLNQFEHFESPLRWSNQDGRLSVLISAKAVREYFAARSVSEAA
jgi:adenine/guanine phosphoribosyltransferase-like PRPP-binding protein